MAANRLGPMFGIMISPVLSLTHLPVDAGSTIGLLAVSKAIGRLARWASVNVRVPLVCRYFVHSALP